MPLVPGCTSFGCVLTNVVHVCGLSDESPLPIHSKHKLIEQFTSFSILEMIKTLYLVRFIKDKIIHQEKELWIKAN